MYIPNVARKCHPERRECHGQCFCANLHKYHIRRPFTLDFLTPCSDSCACLDAGFMSCVGHLETVSAFIAKICTAEPRERKLSTVSEGKGVQRVARPIVGENGIKIK